MFAAVDVTAATGFAMAVTACEEVLVHPAPLVTVTV
jgi:hypothetical protein